MLELLLCALLHAPPVAAAGLSAPGEPFPTSTTTVKVDDSEFYIRGRQALPRNAKVSLLRRCRVDGNEARGEDGKVEGAVLEVAGTLELKAVTGGRVILKDVWIELTPECRSFYATNVRFAGDGGIRASADGPSKADIYIENVDFVQGASLSLACSAGTVTVSSVSSKEPVSLIGAARSDKAESKAKIRVLGCQGGKPGAWRGMIGGLEVSGAKQAIVQFSHLAGGLSRFANNDKLTFAGNNLRSQTVEFAYDKPGRFKRASISGCDVRSKTLSFLAPLNNGKTERLSVKDCWFSAGVEAEAILKEQVMDVSRNEETSAQVSLKKIKESPIGMGGRAGD